MTAQSNLSHEAESENEANSGSQHTFKSTTEYIEYLSSAMMEAHNTLDEAFLRRHLTSDFVMVNDTIHECPLPACSDLETHLDNVKDWKRNHPDFHIRVISISADLVKGSDHASSWVTIRGSKSPRSPTLNRESISLLYWRKRRSDGVWVCYRHNGMRGGGDFFE